RPKRVWARRAVPLSNISMFALSSSGVSANSVRIFFVGPASSLFKGGGRSGPFILNNRFIRSVSLYHRAFPLHLFGSEQGQKQASLSSPYWQVWNREADKAMTWTGKYGHL